MCPCDLSQPPLDEPAAGVAPEEDLCRCQPLLRPRALRELGTNAGAELVRVEVEDGKVSEVPRRQHAPVAPAAGDRKLPEVAELVRLRWNGPNAVGNPRRVELARVVAKARLQEDVIGPRRAPVDRKCGRAVREGPAAGRVGDHLDRAIQVGAKLVRRLVVHARMCVAVTGGLVPATDDLGNEVAVVCDGHPEQEERRTGVELVEQVEQVRRLPLERCVPPVPVREAEPPVDELVPVLEVDRQQQARPLHAATVAMSRDCPWTWLFTPGRGGACSRRRRGPCRLPSRGRARRRPAGRRSSDRPRDGVRRPRPTDRASPPGPAAERSRR